MVRNAGGRVTEDVLRSLVVAWSLLGVDECVVMQHNDCRMSTFTDADLHRELAEQWSIDASSVEFLTFTDPRRCVRDDVDRIRESPLVPDYIAVSGCVYDTNSERVEVVVADPMSRIPLLRTEAAPETRRPVARPIASESDREFADDFARLWSRADLDEGGFGAEG